MANITDLYDDVLPFVPGCPNVLATWAIRKAARRFAEESLAHYVTLTAIDVVAGTRSYAIAPPTGSEIVKVVKVTHAGEELPPMSSFDAELRYGESWKTEQGTPEVFISDTAADVQLVPVPNASLTGGLLVMVALRPTDATATIDDALAVKFRDDIACGARAALWRLPKKPWTAMDRGKEEEADFASRIGRAGAIAEHGRSGSGTKVSNFYYEDQ